MKEDNVFTLNKPIKLVIANGGYILTEKEIVFPVFVADKQIDITAYIVQESFGSVYTLLGTDDLKKMSVTLEFELNTLILRKGIKTSVKISKDVLLGL